MGQPEELCALLFTEVASISAKHAGSWEPGAADSSPKEVLKLAKSIIKVSSKIKMLNKQRFWGASHYLRTDAMFENLADSLYLYGRNIACKASEVLRRLNIYRDPRVGKLQHRAEQELLDKVWEFTGHYYRDKVAAILRVVNLQYGNYPVTGESLRKRGQRKRRS